MRTRRMLLAAALTLALLCAACGAPAETVGQDTFTYQGFSYTVGEDGSATLTGWSGRAERLEVPALLDGHPLTAVGNWAFENQTGLAEVLLPEGVTELGRYAFCGCSSLTRIRLPESLKAIGDCCFILCTHLEELTLPAACTRLGANPFAYCGDLTEFSLTEGPLTLVDGCMIYHRIDRRLISVLAPKVPQELTLPADCVTVGRYAVVGCSALEALNLPATVQSVELYGVYHCVTLSRVSASAALSQIGDGAFTWCDRLTVHVPAGSALARYCAEHEIPVIAE